jgi:succinate-acetate transporter protein
MGIPTVARASSSPPEMGSRDMSAATSPSVSGAWANAAPLALTAFAVVTFMLSMVNAGWVDKDVAPVVSSVALMFGGGTQLIAGFICLRNGNVFAGTLFSTFGAFWLAYFANVSYFLKQMPPAQAGNALGLFLCGFAIYTVVMLFASFSTDRVTSVALTFLLLTIIALGVGNYWARTGLIHWGGYLGLVTAALAGYLAAAGISEASYGRTVLPVGSYPKR